MQRRQKRIPSGHDRENFSLSPTVTTLTVSSCFPRCCTRIWLRLWLGLPLRVRVCSAIGVVAVRSCKIFQKLLRYIVGVPVRASIRRACVFNFTSMWCAHEKVASGGTRPLLKDQRLPYWFGAILIRAHGSIVELLRRSCSLELLLVRLQRRFAVHGELVLLHLAAGSVRQTAVGLPAQLVSRGSDCRPQLRCGREQRSFLLVRGLTGAQGIGEITVFRSPWPIYPSLSLPLSSHIQIRCSSFPSVWKRSPSSSNASGEPQSVEGLWKEYFADPTQWWDNRVDKRSPRSPDFRHKVTRQALWIYGWSTPPWVNALLNSASEGKMHPCVDCGTKDSQDTTQSDRLSKGHNGEGSNLPSATRESRHIVQGGGGGVRRVGARTTIEAIGNFKTRIKQGMAIDSYMYVEVLRRCLKEDNLKVNVAKQVHDCINQSGMEQNRYVANNLVSVYIRCGELEAARGVFDKLVEKNVFSWTIMIGGYAKHNYAEEAMELFKQMCRSGVHPDAFTFTIILKACANPSALQWGKEVHACVRHAGLESDLRVGNALVHMYANCGSIDDARVVFGRMEEHNVISWNIIIGGLAEHGFGQEACELFLQMQREGCIPDVSTYLSILNPRASAGALEWVKEVHRHVLQAGLESNLRVGTALVRMYGKSGNSNNARAVFDRMEDRDVITWNVMIGGLAEHGCGSEAYGLILQMKQEGVEPNAITYASILNPLASAGALEWVKEVHRHVLQAGLESDLRVGNALVHMYAKCGSLDDARVVFDRMEDRDVITWNVMIGGLAQHGYGSEAYGLLLQMKQEGVEPNAFTYASILNSCSSAGALDWVKEVHRHVLHAGLESDLRVGNALVHMNAKCGSLGDARAVFDRMEDRDVVTWTVMIGGLAEHGCGHEALELFKTMIAGGVMPNEISLVAVLSACSHSGLVEEGRKLFGGMTQDYGIEPSVVLCNCMVDVLGRAGHLEEAKLFIDNMPVEPDGATWRALLGACRTYGNAELGKLASDELLKLEPKDASAFVLLSNIYAAAGKWEEVLRVRSVMQERGIRKEPGRSWIEVDNKVHDFVVSDTSHPEAKEIYAELKRLSERIKGEGYIPDTRPVLQNIEEEEKELALCSHSEKLAITYGLLRTPRGKPIRVFKNLRVCSDCHIATKFISKVTERDIVVRDANRFHHFQDGVCSCGDYW